MRTLEGQVTIGILSCHLHVKFGALNKGGEITESNRSFPLEAFQLHILKKSKKAKNGLNSIYNSSRAPKT